MATAPFRFETPDDLPPVGTAVALGLAILATAKERRWVDLPQGLEGLNVELSDEQREILERHEPKLAFVRGTIRSTDGREGRSAVTIALCDECGRWMLAGSGSLPRNCPLTVGCDGKLAKVKQAKRVEVPKKPRKKETSDDGDQAP